MVVGTLGGSLVIGAGELSARAQIYRRPTVSISWRLLRRAASGTTGVLRGVEIAMDIRPTRFRPSVAVLRFHLTTAREGVLEARAAALNPNEETRRNAISNSRPTARFAVGFQIPATLLSAGQQLLIDTPIACDQTVRSASLAWKPRGADADEFLRGESQSRSRRGALYEGGYNSISLENPKSVTALGSAPSSTHR